MINTLKIRTLIVGQLKTNCYLVTDTKSNETGIIDPGDDTDYITQTISDYKLKPIFVVATHGHFDHILALSELKLIYKIPFLLHTADEFLLSRMISSANHFLQTKPTSQIPTVDRPLTDKMLVTIGTVPFTIIHTPGHTPGSICLYSEKSSVLFSGDTLFASGVGRTDFQYSSSEKLKTSLFQLFSLPLKTVVYSGHGQTTTIEAEKNQ